MIDVLTEELRAPITEETAELYVGGTVFKTGPPRRVGVELEWLVQDADDPGLPVRPGRLAGALAEQFDPPLAGRLTTEPGGQLELSSPPAPLAGCLAGTAADLDRLRRRLAGADLALVGRGLDPRPPALVADTPRYAAMARHFAAGTEGLAMMCSTASVQVCLDAGADEADLTDRWRALHAWLPVLVALFANSPSRGWRSTRTPIWAAIDPSRTTVPYGGADGGVDPRTGYARWALDARVLAVRRPGRDWSAPPGLTFRGWLRGGSGLRPPTRDDLDYHLSTLFPPVRARGHLELRAVDAQPGDGWRVVTALVGGLLDDPAARAEATAAARTAAAGRPGSVLRVAARAGMCDPALRAAGTRFVAAAAAALVRAGLPAVAGEVRAFGERYPGRGRCPADDLIERAERA